VFEEDGLSFVYIQHSNLYLVAATTRNSDPSLVILFLYKVVEVFSKYFKSLEEESIRDNFVITYELLDEMCDWGYPQLTEHALLQKYITQEGQELNKAQVKVPESAMSKFPWRPPGIRHRKNEIFLDIIEKVNCLIGSDGRMLRSEVVGQVHCRCFLSGMPELRLGLNDKVVFAQDIAAGRAKGGIEMEDVAFHQCVNLPRFEADRMITFVPPDGEFDLMTYRLTAEIKPLFQIEALVESHAHSRIEYLIKARSQFKPRSVANNVTITIPVPADADSPKFRTSTGVAVYAPDKNAILWTIKQFPGGKEFLLRAHFGLPSVDSEEKQSPPPISVVFEIPYFTVSGIQVRYLRVVERVEKYQALPWVRYITMNGEYQQRTNI